MIRLPAPLLPLLLSALLASCGSGGGDSASPPANVTVRAQDGAAQLTYTAEAGVTYWAFAAPSATITAFNWVNIPGSVSSIDIRNPAILCGLNNDKDYWFTINGRKDGGPGGDGSPPVSTTTRRAGTSWTLQGGVFAGDTINGIGTSPIARCTTITPAVKTYFITQAIHAAVGNNGAVYASPDGITWTRGTTPGGTGQLNAVAGYTYTVDSAGVPDVRFVAVGNGGSVLYSGDRGTTYSTIATTAANGNDLLAVANNGSYFVAVGRNGTIIRSPDGQNWGPVASNTTADLNAVLFVNNAFIAVGQGGVIRTGGNDGVAWNTVVSPTTNNLRDVVYGNNNLNPDNATGIAINTYVAVGDAGTVLYSYDAATWQVQAGTGISTAVNLRRVSYTSHFVAFDTGGNAYGNTFALNAVPAWTGLVAPGVGAPSGVTTTGFGLITVGGNSAAHTF